MQARTRAREVVRVALDAASRRAKMLDDAERAVRNDDAVPLAVRVRLRALAGDVATLAAFTVDETAGEERWFALVDALSGAVVGADLLKAALAAEGKGADGEACAPRAAAAELAAVAEALISALRARAALRAMAKPAPRWRRRKRPCARRARAPSGRAPFS